MAVVAKKKAKARKKKREKGVAPDLATRQADDLIARKDLVALVASRIREPYDSEQTARNRASKAVGYAVEEKGVLSESGRGKFRLADAIDWAKEQWPEQLADMQRKQPLEAAVAGTIVVSDHSDAGFLPGDVPRCHDEIRRLSREVEELRAELSRCRRQVAADRPEAERWRNFRAKSGRKPGAR